MNIISWIVFGLIAGSLANLIDPEKSSGGILGSSVLGILGAVIGGWLGSTVFGVGVSGFNISSLIVAVVGSLVLLLVGRMFRRV